MSRSGDHVIKNGRHTTGYYTTNAYGEAPPSCTFSKTKYEENYKIDPHVCIGLPKVVGKYGLSDHDWSVLRGSHRLSSLEDMASLSWISVHKKGDTTGSLCMKFTEDVILPLYPNTRRVIVRCPVTGRQFTGPLVIKTDAGPGRLCKEAINWAFRKHMFERGVYIILGLPNSTATAQDMDQGYAEFQPAVKQSTEQVVSRELGE